MNGNPLIKALWAICIALFFAVQSASIAHSAEHGGHEHEHDGVACEIMVLPIEQAVLTPPLVVIPPCPRPTPEIAFFESGWVYLAHFEGRAPPPRGPPL